MKIMVALVLALLLALGTTQVFAADVDHTARAEQYEKEAAEAEASAARHDKMAESYRGAGKIGVFHAENHCKAIAARYREQAKDLKALAAAERDAAKTPK
jgi:hypothetical protein